jgi:hypothetical protein
MHGTMFVHLRDYVEHEMGASGWPELLREANLGQRLYLPIKAYPDEEMMLLSMRRPRPRRSRYRPCSSASVNTWRRNSWPCTGTC